MEYDSHMKFLHWIENVSKSFLFHEWTRLDAVRTSYIHFRISREIFNVTWLATHDVWSASQIKQFEYYMFPAWQMLWLVGSTRKVNKWIKSNKLRVQCVRRISTISIWEVYERIDKCQMRCNTRVSLRLYIVERGAAFCQWNWIDAIVYVRWLINVFIL